MIYSIAQALAHEAELSNSPPKPTQVRRQKGLKQLRLSVGAASLHFKSLDDFSFAIESRTSVPSARFDDLLKRSPSELWDEAENIKLVEKNLVDILEDALIETEPCGPAIRELGLQVFSNDHDWRALMESLNELGDEFDGYKRLALIKYLQYLGARQELLRLIFAMTITDSSEHSTLAKQSGVDFEAGETILFDLIRAGDADPTENPLQQLPQGEAVRVHALPGHAIDIRVGKYPFKLMNADGWVLCDPHGRRFALSDGQNLIGRGRDSDIPLSKEFRNVSRRHLIAEPIDDHIILLTDISSHGTYAPPLHLELSSV